MVVNGNSSRNLSFHEAKQQGTEQDTKMYKLCQHHIEIVKNWIARGSPMAESCQILGCIVHDAAQVPTVWADMALARNHGIQNESLRSRCARALMLEGLVDTYEEAREVCSDYDDSIVQEKLSHHSV